MNGPPNPHLIGAWKALGDPEEIARLKVQVYELSNRLEDLATFVYAHVQTEPITDDPPPVADVLAVHFGTCDHGQLLRDPCPYCQRRTT